MLSRQHDPSVLFGAKTFALQDERESGGCAYPGETRECPYTSGLGRTPDGTGGFSWYIFPPLLELFWHAISHELSRSRRVRLF